jgi:hypothetical protein
MVDETARFTSIFMVLLLGFSFSFLAMYQSRLAYTHEYLKGPNVTLNEHPREMNHPANNAHPSNHMYKIDSAGLVAGHFNAVISSWRIALGDFDYIVLCENSRFDWFQKLMWFFSLLILSVMMLNMLIGLMTFGESSF